MNLRITMTTGAALLAGLSNGWLAGCSSSSSADAGPAGGAVSGVADMHCRLENGTPIKNPVGICMTGSAVDAGPSSGSDAATITPPDAGANGSDFGDPLYNTQGDDDDCKYQVSWTSTPVRRDSDVTFDLMVTRLLDGQPATGADVQVEAFLTVTHPSPSVDIVSHEPSPGHYSVGPVRFDQAGMWTVRFHFYELCSDAPEDSPHGHIAFFVQVP
jgi:hypothetical protein